MGVAGCGTAIADSLEASDATRGEILISCQEAEMKCEVDDSNLRAEIPDTWCSHTVLIIPRLDFGLLEDRVAKRSMLSPLEISIYFHRLNNEHDVYG